MLLRSNAKELIQVLPYRKNLDVDGDGVLRLLQTPRVR